MSVSIAGVQNTLRAVLVGSDAKDAAFLLLPWQQQQQEISVDRLVTYMQENFPDDWRRRLSAGLSAVNLSLAARLVSDGDAGFATDDLSNKFRLLLFRAASECGDSEANDLATRLGLASPVGAGFSDALDVMSEAARGGVVTETNVAALERLGGEVARLCVEYRLANVGVNGIERRSTPMGLDSGSGLAGDVPQPAPAPPTPPSHDAYVVDKRLCAIINVSIERDGSEDDVKLLRSVFDDELGYEVRELSNPDERKLREFVDNLADSVAPRYDMLLLFAMGHGSRGDLLKLADGSYSQLQTSVIGKFLNGRLRHKPKVFVLQCCRGDQLNTPPQLQFDGEPRRTDADVSDMAVYHSTYDGYLSARGIFIRAFCDSVRHSVDGNFTDVQLQTNRAVESQLLNYNAEGFVQVPALEKGTLKKRLLLRPPANASP